MDKVLKRKKEEMLFVPEVFFLKKENESLKKEINKLRRELNKFKNSPLLVCELIDLFKDKALIKTNNGNLLYVEILSPLEKSLKNGDFVLVEQRSMTIVDVLKNKSLEANKFLMVEKPKIDWNDIGGLANEIKEIKEVVELPLKKPGLFRKVGIEPPRGVLLYGPSGCGKTMLAKAIANSTNSTFIEIVASELVQKYIGEGAKLVKNVFKLARENAPSIIFIDEIDAIASKRYYDDISGEKEVQRTFMQLLAEIDGFDPLGNVKIIGATNRIDALDPALLRPGRLDRLIEVKIPNQKGREEIFKIYTKKMNLGKINLKELAKMTNQFTGAEIKAVCTEAGYFAIRENRTEVKQEDFVKAINKVKEIEEENKEYMKVFG